MLLTGDKFDTRPRALECLCRLSTAGSDDGLRAFPVENTVDSAAQRPEWRAPGSPPSRACSRVDDGSDSSRRLAQRRAHNAATRRARFRARAHGQDRRAQYVDASG